MEASRSRAGKVETSKRLQATAHALRSAAGRGVTTLGIFQFTGSMAIHSDIHALRCNGYDIERIAERKTEGGCKVNRYFLRHEPEHLRLLLTGSAGVRLIDSASSSVPLVAGPENRPGAAGDGAFFSTEELQQIEDDEVRSLEGWA